MSAFGDSTLNVADGHGIIQSALLENRAVLLIDGIKVANRKQALPPRAMCCLK
ncbi:MAG: hypothetical protein ACLR56_14085 [Oscillospiraceae bacterium]